jgi:hypothetical protein
VPSLRERVTSTCTFAPITSSSLKALPADRPEAPASRCRAPSSGNSPEKKRAQHLITKSYLVGLVIPRQPPPIVNGRMDWTSIGQACGL